MNLSMAFTCCRGEYDYYTWQTSKENYLFQFRCLNLTLSNSYKDPCREKKHTDQKHKSKQRMMILITPSTGPTGLTHQATIPLVFSDLLTQAVQLQLVDLQVRPDGEKEIIFAFVMLKKEAQLFPACSEIFHLAAIPKLSLKCVYSL